MRSLLVKRVLVIATPLLFAAALPAWSAQKTLQDAQVQNLLKDVQQLGYGPTTKDFVVDGETRFDGWFLKAAKLVFKKGGTLVFTTVAQQKRTEFFIVAQAVVSEDAGSSGTITWERSGAPPAASMSGQAGTGGGGGENAPGGPGLPGAQGGPGISGASAPSLTLITLAMPGAGPTIDFQGQSGGKGGQGQQGGSGGPGGPGNSASQNAFNCNRGAGNGGPGGTGGSGGPGGPGGKGGNGGRITVIATSDLIPFVPQRLRALQAAGMQGPGGDGGPGGVGGPGGPGGAQQLPYCQGNGGTGGPGAVGPAGGTGPQPNATGKGVDGDVLVGTVTAADFTSVVWGGGAARR